MHLQSELESRGLPQCDGVVNLAGENLMNPLRWWVSKFKVLISGLFEILIFFVMIFVPRLRWNESYKKDLFSSRIDTTKALSQAIAASSSPPHSWVLVSGVGNSELITDSMWGIRNLLANFVVFFPTLSVLQTQPDGRVHGGQRVDAARPPLTTHQRVGGCGASSWESVWNHQASRHSARYAQNCTHTG